MLITAQGDIAGSTNSIFYLARGLSERGHNIVVGCRRESLLWSLLEGTKAIRFPMTFKSKVDFKNMRQIRDACVKHNIQIINAQAGKDRFTTVFSKWWYGLEVKIVHTRRQMPRYDGGFFENQFYQRGTAKVIAVSEGVKRGLLKKGLAESHIEVIRNGTPMEKYNLTDPDKTERFRKSLGIQDHEVVIGCIARKKRQEELIAALIHIRRPLRVLFVGIEKEPKYDEFISQYSSPHILNFTGTVSGDDVLYYYPLLKVKILPSRIEGLSQALLESMVMGVPIVATKIAGNLDLIRDGENGVFYEFNNPPDLAIKIEKLLDDPALCARIIEEGKKTVENNYKLERVLDQYEVFFDSIIKPQAN